jgi:Ca-activated chloride channel family protein
MSFLWPKLLWLLLLAPVLVALYVLMLRRRKRAVRFASLGLVKEAIGPGQRFRRHVPPALLLAALVAMVVGTARPSAVVTLPSEHRTVILAIDVSLSMRATDVDPSRITAAQAAARSFIEEQPPNLRVGIVAFGGAAALVQPPTSNREELLAAIDRFQLQRGTATGSALLVSIATLFPDAGIDVEALGPGSGHGAGRDALRGPSRGPGEAGRDGPKVLGQERAPRPDKPAFTPVPPGSYESAVVILLSDGRRTTGPDPVEAAKMAAERGLRVFTVGFGTREGTSVDFGGWSIYVRLDEEALKAVAEITRAEYFHAGTADDLKKVYQGLNSKLVLERKETEISALFAAAAAALSIAAGLLSLLWFRRPL